MKEENLNPNVASICVLDNKGFLMETKFMKPLNELPKVGEKVVSFYDETFVLYDTMISSVYEGDGQIKTLNETLTASEMFEKMIDGFAELVNVVANSDLEDLTMINRDGFSSVRLMEAALNRIYRTMDSEKNVVFEKKTYLMDEVKNLLNKVSLYVLILGFHYNFGKNFGGWKPKTPLDQRRGDFCIFLKQMKTIVVHQYREDEKLAIRDAIINSDAEDDEKEDAEESFYDYTRLGSPRNLENMINFVSLSYNQIEENVDYFGVKKCD